VFEALRQGADGYIEKSGSVEDIAAAVEAVASGTQVFSIDQQRAAQAHLGDLVRRSREAARVAATLTPRERQTLDLIADGLTTRQIANRVSISQRTVETHIRNLYEKLDVRTRVQAIRRAAALNLIRLGRDSGEPSRRRS
jgi:DNA-binding NarL/FixJ family response regulator